MIPHELSNEQGEHEVIAAAFCRPDLYTTLQHIRPSWFANWADKRLWGCLQFCFEFNGGPEPEVIDRLLKEHYAGEAGGLLERLANIVDGYLHARHLTYYCRIVERAGIRRELVDWSRTLIELCESGATFADIREHLASSPTPPAGLTDGEVAS